MNEKLNAFTLTVESIDSRCPVTQVEVCSAVTLAMLDGLLPIKGVDKFTEFENLRGAFFV